MNKELVLGMWYMTVNFLDQGDNGMFFKFKIRFTKDNLILGMGSSSVIGTYFTDKDNMQIVFSLYTDAKTYGESGSNAIATYVGSFYSNEYGAMSGKFGLCIGQDSYTGTFCGYTSD